MTLIAEQKIDAPSSSKTSELACYVLVVESLLLQPWRWPPHPYIRHEQFPSRTGSPASEWPPFGLTAHFASWQNGRCDVRVMTSSLLKQVGIWSQSHPLFVFAAAPQLIHGI